MLCLLPNFIFGEYLHGILFFAKPDVNFLLSTIKPKYIRTFYGCNIKI